jgi:hypothetical protein
VRLDHLLSKEHLTPAPPLWWGVVCRASLRACGPEEVLEGGTSVRRRSCLAWPQYSLPGGGGNGSGGCGWCLARCWVLRDQGFRASAVCWCVLPVGGGVGFWFLRVWVAGPAVVVGVVALLVRAVPRCTARLFPVWGWVGFGAGVGVVAVRSLRTAQWTRASLIFVVKFLRAHGGCLGTRSR